MLYGVAAAVMLASVVLWFSSYNEVMTSDKFVYLFGRVIPALSLVLSMALRFIPKFKAQMQTVSEAQACIGRDTKNGSVFQRVGNAVKIFSIMVTWSLENAIETADSMRSRGYGLPGRTAFSIYRFDDRDKAALAWLSFLRRVSRFRLDGGRHVLPVLSDGKRRRMDAHDGEFYARVSRAGADAGDSRPKGGQAVELFAIKHLNFAYPEQEQERDLRFLAVRPAGRISGALRPVRVREIDAFAAAENRACTAWTKERPDPV